MACLFLLFSPHNRGFTPSSCHWRFFLISGLFVATVLVALGIQANFDPEESNTGGSEYISDETRAGVNEIISYATSPEQEKFVWWRLADCCDLFGGRLSGSQALEVKRKTAV